MCRIEKKSERPYEKTHGTQAVGTGRPDREKAGENLQCGVTTMICILIVLSQAVEEAEALKSGAVRIKTHHLSRKHSSITPSMILLQGNGKQKKT